MNSVAHIDWNNHCCLPSLVMHFSHLKQHHSLSLYLKSEGRVSTRMETKNHQWMVFGCYLNRKGADGQQLIVVCE